MRTGGDVFQMERRLDFRGYGNGPATPPKLMELICRGRRQRAASSVRDGHDEPVVVAERRQHCARIIECIAFIQ